MNQSEALESKPMIFISHRSTDKPFVDVFVNFLLVCGIRSELIFCSSLPGNDIKASIPGEVKENLKRSGLNIAVLSDEYYGSPYCMNEAGIIWYLDTPKQIICMPEVNDKLMEGFLDSDNRIHRLDNKDDILAMVDYIRPLFPNFIASLAKLNANIDKLIKDYKKELETRIAPAPVAVSTGTNSLENRILSDDFIVEELAALRFLYDEKTDTFDQSDSSFTSWLSTNKIEIKASIEITRFLLESKIATVYSGDYNGLHSVQLTVTSYQELMKLSLQAISWIDTALTKIKNRGTEAKASASSGAESDNQLDGYIANGFNDYEILLIKYAYDCNRIKFLCGWQTSSELSKIKAWEDINSIAGLSNNYENTLDRLYMRKIIIVSEITSYGNTKEYRFSDDALHWIDNLAPISIDRMSNVAEKYKVMTLDDSDSELPF